MCLRRQALQFVAILSNTQVESVRQLKINNSQLPQCRRHFSDRDLGGRRCDDECWRRGTKETPWIIQWDASIINTRCAPLIWGQLVVGLEGFAAVLQQEHLSEIRYSEQPVAAWYRRALQVAQRSISREFFSDR